MTVSVKKPFAFVLSLMLSLPGLSEEGERGVYFRHGTHRHLACIKKKDAQKEGQGFQKEIDFEDDCIPYACIQRTVGADSKTAKSEEKTTEDDKKKGGIKSGKNKCDVEVSHQTVKENEIKEGFKRACEDFVNVSGGKGDPFETGYEPPSRGKILKDKCKNKKSSKKTSIKFAKWGFPKPSDETKKEEDAKKGKTPETNHVDCLMVLKTLGAEGPKFEGVGKYDEEVIDDWVKKFREGPKTLDGVSVQLTVGYRCDFKHPEEREQSATASQDKKDVPTGWSKRDWTLDNTINPGANY